jgi:leucyl-tRNA synthetase
VWALAGSVVSGDAYTEQHESLIHKTIRKVTHDVETLKYNTAVAALMTLSNELSSPTRAEFETLLKLMHPFTPHITEELWAELGNSGLLAAQPWPEYNEEKAKDAQVTFAVQVNGKLRGTVELPAGSTQDAAVAAAMTLPKVAPVFEGAAPKRVIFVTDKLVNLIG